MHLSSEGEAGTARLYDDDMGRLPPPGAAKMDGQAGGQMLASVNSHIYCAKAFAVVGDFGCSCRRSLVALVGTRLTINDKYDKNTSVWTRVSRLITFSCSMCKNIKNLRTNRAVLTRVSRLITFPCSICKNIKNLRIDRLLVKCTQRGTIAVWERFTLKKNRKEWDVLLSER